MKSLPLIGLQEGCARAQPGPNDARSLDYGCEGPQPSKPPPIIVATNGWALLADPLEGARSVGAVKGCQFTAGHGCEGPQPSRGFAKRCLEAQPGCEGPNAEKKTEARSQKSGELRTSNPEPQIPNPELRTPNRGQHPRRAYSIGRDLPIEWKAWGFTAVGVLCFSGTFASTRLALSAFDPFVVALVRGTGAGAAALFYLLISRSGVPSKPQFLRLGGAALGIVIGFPCLFSFALLMVPATHASVVGAILPLLTAFFGVVIGRERASRGFWISAMIGTLLTTLFCLYRSGFSAIQGADILLLLAFVACSYGYAEGGILSKELGGWRVICWALALAFPIELVAFLGYVWTHGLWIRPPSVEACAGLLYVTAISQYIGFYFYYRGLALGGVAKMSQMQLFLPFCAIAVSYFVLGETIDAATIVGAILITGTVFGGKFYEATRSRNFQAPEALERAQRHFL